MVLSLLCVYERCIVNYSIKMFETTITRNISRIYNKDVTEESFEFMVERRLRILLFQKHTVSQNTRRQ